MFTVAWYKVTDAAHGTSAGNPTIGGVTVGGPAVAATTYNYKITTTLVEQDSTKNKDLLLSTWDSSNNVYKTQYLNTGNGAESVTPTSGQTLYKLYAITVSAAWRNSDDTADVTLSADEKTALLASSTELYSISFSEVTSQKIGEAAATNLESGASGTEIWVQANNTVGQKGSNTTSITGKTMTQIATAISSSSGVLGYLVVRMEGAVSNYTHQGTYTITVTPTVTVATPSNNP